MVWTREKGAAAVFCCCTMVKGLRVGDFWLEQKEKKVWGQDTWSSDGCGLQLSRDCFPELELGPQCLVRKGDQEGMVRGIHSRRGQEEGKLQLVFYCSTCDKPQRLCLGKGKEQRHSTHSLLPTWFSGSCVPGIYMRKLH